jgi:hypothetical protein
MGEQARVPRNMGIFPHLSESQSHRHNDMDDRKNSEGITERPMDDMPETENLASPGKKQNSFGE